MSKKVFSISLSIVLVMLAFIAVKGVAQIPEGIGFEEALIDGVGGNLEPGDNPEVLHSVFTLLWRDKDENDFGIPGANFGIVVTKFLINRLGNAPLSDVTGLQIRLFDAITGEKLYEGIVVDPLTWPIPSAELAPTFEGVTIPDNGGLAVEIRPFISNRPKGGTFGVSIQLEGSEGGTLLDTGGSKKVFEGFKTGFIPDPILEVIEPEFKVVEAKGSVISIPASNLNPNNIKNIHKFEVSLLIDDKITTPELNNTPLKLGFLQKDGKVVPPFIFSLTGIGTFVPGCIAKVDIVDQQTNQSLIGGPQDATGWGSGKVLAFPLYPEDPKLFPDLSDFFYRFIPPFVPDDEKFNLNFSADVWILLAPPELMPPECDESTIGADIDIMINFGVIEAGKMKEVAQEVKGILKVPDTIIDTIYNRAFEQKIINPWTFETLDQKEVEKLGPSTIAKTTLTVTDEDSSNDHPVWIPGVVVFDLSPKVFNGQACPDPGIVAVQVQDANGNTLGSAPGLGSRFEIWNPDGSPVIVPDGDMGKPSEMVLMIKLITRDMPPPDLIPGCKLVFAVELAEVEGKNEFSQVLVPPHFQIPWQAITVGIESLKLKAGQEGAIEITVNTPYLGTMTASIVLDHDKLDVRKLFDVTQVLAAGPYMIYPAIHPGPDGVLQSRLAGDDRVIDNLIDPGPDRVLQSKPAGDDIALPDIRDADIDGDGVLETVVTFIVTLAPGQMPAAGTVARIRGRAAEADVKDALEELGVDMTIHVNFLAAPVLIDAVGQPIPPPVIVTAPGIVIDPEESMALLY